MPIRSVAMDVAVLILAICCHYSIAGETDDRKLKLADVFEPEYASDPHISANGETVVHARNFMDIRRLFLRVPSDSRKRFRVMAKSHVRRV